MDDALVYLQKAKGKDGVSVFDHLTSMLMKVLEERPEQAVDLLETSILASKSRNHPEQSNPLLPIPQQDPAAKLRTEAARALFCNPEPKINPETGEPQELETPNEYETEDIAEQAILLEAVGAGLARSELLAVAMAVKKLGEDPELKLNTVRFFGKMLGTHADYYVYECTLKDAGEETLVGESGPDAVPPELGSGANAYTYFVASHPGGPVTRLPDVTPRQIKVARQVKKFLTGSLSSPVSAYPPFPGTEANYLRALLARISCTTVLCPAGMFTAGEDGTSVEKAEDFSPPEASALGEVANWAHRYQHLKKQGRCVVHQREAAEDEEEPPEPTEEEAEEGPALLTTVDQDAELPSALPAWSPVTSSALNGAKFAISGIRSNLWPGACAVARGMTFVNIYVGYGMKNAPFVPLPPPAIAKEFDASKMESQELPPKPKPVEEGEGEEEDD